MPVHLRKEMDMVETKAGQSAGGRHGSRGNDDGETVDRTSNGLNENTGEFRVGEKIIFGTRNGNILIRHSPQGDEVEVAEAVLAGLMIDAFFTDKFKGEYSTVTGQPTGARS
jgi:hypothetical protein